MAAAKVIVIGTGGTCSDIVDTLHDINTAHGETLWQCLGFLDDNSALQGTEIAGLPVLGAVADAAAFAAKYTDVHFINGIGSPRTFHRKKEIIARTRIPRERFITVVHPTASVSRSARLGRGVAVLPHVTIATNACIGDHVVVLPNSVISHDVTIGSYSCVAGGVCISGGVVAGASCYLGAGSSIIDGISIGEQSLIGLGSAVIRDVPPNTVVVGNPAKVLRKVVPD